MNFRGVYGYGHGETKPSDTHVNSEIWLYFTMQTKKSQKFLCSVAFTNLKRWIDSKVRVKNAPLVGWFKSQR